MENCLDGAAEGVVAAEEGGFVGELRGVRCAGSVIGAARRGGSEDVECEAEALESAVDNVRKCAPRQPWLLGTDLVDWGWNGGLSGWQILDRSR